MNNTQIAIVATVKAPLQELSYFINYHLGLVNQIWLFFDDPLDETANQLTEITGLTTVICDSAYWAELGGRPDIIEKRQELNATQALSFSKSKSIDWLIHIDSDELIYGSRSQLKKILHESSADIVRFGIREAIVDRLHYSCLFQPIWFKKPSSPQKIKLANLFGCRHAVYQNEFFRGHLASKIATRVNGSVIEMGIHAPRRSIATPKEQHTDDILLLHYDCVGFDAWYLKWKQRIDGVATASRMRENRQNQLQAFIKALTLGKLDLERLYVSMYVLSWYEKWMLWMLGMAQVIHVVKRCNAESIPLLIKEE